MKKGDENETHDSSCRHTVNLCTLDAKMELGCLRRRFKRESKKVGDKASPKSFRSGSKMSFAKSGPTVFDFICAAQALFSLGS